MIQLVIG